MTINVRFRLGGGHFIMGNHTSQAVTETSDVEVGETVSHEASYGFHILELHMGSVAATSVILLCLMFWCLCSVAVLARFRPALGRIWWRATRGTRKARARSRGSGRRRTGNFELCSLTYQERKAGPRRGHPGVNRPDSPCDACKKDIASGTIKDEMDIRSNYSV